MTENELSGDSGDRLTLHEIAQDLDVSYETIRRWATSGAAGFPRAIRVGPRLLKVDRSAYEAWKARDLEGEE